MRITAPSAFFALSFCLFFFPIPAFAFDHKNVLGEATSTKDLSTISMSPTVEGPGIFLPDSPFFFLDIIKQEARTLLAITSDQRAKVHANIAGERMAELRFMLSRNNEKGVKVAMDGVAENFSSAANDLSDAKMHGADVSSLAKQINDDLKAKQLVLDSLSVQSNQELRERIDSINTSLFSAKMHIEDSMKQDDLQNELADDIDWYLSHQVKKTTATATQTERELAELEREANESGQKELTVREQALKTAIKEKKRASILKEQKKLQDAQAVHDISYQLHKDAAEAASQTIKHAKETQEKINALQEAKKSL